MTAKSLRSLLAYEFSPIYWHFFQADSSFLGRDPLGLRLIALETMAKINSSYDIPLD